MSDRDAAWLAGVIEGDGSLTTAGGRKVPSLKLRCADRPLVQEAARLMGGNVTYFDDPRGSYQRIWSTSRAGRDTFPILERMLPHFGKHRRAQAEHRWGVTTDVVEPGSHEWAAGLMEAEGLFRLYRRGDGRRELRPRVQLEMVDRDVVEKACGVWEIDPERIGTCRRPDGRRRRAHHAATHRIQLSSKDAYHVARSVFPFLRGERKRADIAVWLGGQLVT